MNDNEKLIFTFYDAFKQKDFVTMQRLYHDEARFTDPVFQDLSAREVRAMWQMLITSSHDLEIEVSDISANEYEGRCRWEAWYTFSRTGRRVHNVIDASFVFKDGSIHRHRDRFNFWRWSGMALGMTGLLLGWTPIVRNKVSMTADTRLKKFMDAVREKSK